MMESTLVSNCHWEAIPWQGELAPQTRADWDYLAGIDPHMSIYHCRAWFEIACRTQAIAPWGIVVVHRGSHPIGLFPLYKRTPWTWELVSYFTQGGPQVLIDPQAAREAWAGFVTWFRNMPKTALLSLGVCGHAPHITHFTQACAAQRLTMRQQRSRLPLIQSRLPDTWEEFLAGMDPAARKQVRHAEKLLLRDYPDATVEYLSEPSSCMALLEELIRLYCLRWRCQVGGCRFDDRRHLDFYRAAVRWALERGYATLSVLRVGDRPIIISTLFHLPGQQLLSEDLVARDISALPKRHSPGIVESSYTMRWAIKQGFHVVNQGLGSSYHKLMLAGEELPLWEISAAQSDAAMTLLKKWDRCLYLSHRIPMHIAYRLRQMATLISSRRCAGCERG